MMNFACVCPGYFPLLGTIKTIGLQSKHTGYIHSVKIDTYHPYKPTVPKGAPCSLWAWVVYKRWMKEYSHKLQLQHLIPLQEEIYVNFISYILSYILYSVKLHLCNEKIMPYNNFSLLYGIIKYYPILYPLETSFIMASIPFSRLSKNTCFAFGDSFIVKVFWFSSIQADHTEFCCSSFINHYHLW